jgi:monofunctional biosynthetic peptidoglycan transglycosylase
MTKVIDWRVISAVKFDASLPKSREMGYVPDREADMGARKGGMWLRWTRNAAFLAVSAVVASMAFYCVYPDLSVLQHQRPAKTSFMSYRERQWEKEGLRREIRQEWVPLSAVSPYVIKAVLIAEDDKFWSHEGFDFEAIQKAIEKDLRKRRLKAGGSTISQQLVKNLYLTPDKNPVRKLKEAILTWRLERNLTKKRILEIYLNVVEWGDGIFGIEAAARHHFGKGAGSLSAREAAALAVVLPSPLRYNPTGGGKYVESRIEAVYRIMARRGLVPGYEQLLEEMRPEGSPPDQRADEGAGQGETAEPGGGEGG